MFPAALFRQPECTTPCWKLQNRQWSLNRLKGYNVKEILPENIGEFKVPLGVPEIMREGTDITFVTYGWNVHHAVKAANLLQTKGISAEVIDVQTLLPFDVNHVILASIKKTNKVLFIDEDVPGGATAYMMQKVLEEQKSLRLSGCFAPDITRQGTPARIRYRRRVFLKTQRGTHL